MPVAVRQQRIMPIGATPVAPVRTLGMNDISYNAAQGLVNQTVNLALQLHQKAALSDMASERADFEGFVNQQKLEAAQFRAENEDTDIADGLTSYQQDWDKRYKAIQARADKLKWQDNKNDILNSLKVRSAAWDADVESDVLQSRHDRALRSFEEFQTSVLNTDYTAETMAENKLRQGQNSVDGKGLPQISQREYKLQLIKQQADILANSGAIRQSEVPRYLAQADAVLTKAESEQVFNKVYSDLIAIANTDDNGQPLATPDYNRAIKTITDKEVQKALGYDAEKISQLTNMIENQKTAYEKTQAAEIDKTLVDFQNRMNKGEIPDANVYQQIFNSNLPVTGDNSKQKMWEKWNKVYRGEEQDTDPQTAANIKERINNLYRGKETAEQIKADIKKEFQAGRITNNGNQNNSYTGLLNDVDNKWNNIQGEIIQSTYNKAKSTNLYVAVSGSTTDEENIKKQQIINGYLCDLDSALKDYIKSNPNASIKDIQTQADILRRTYSDRAMNEINASTEPKTTKLEKAMKAIDIYTKAFAFPYYTNFALAKSVVNKISEPQRVVVIKDGKRFTLPKEQLDDALSQGYTLAE